MIMVMVLIFVVVGAVEAIHDSEDSGRKTIVKITL